MSYHRVATLLLSAMAVSGALHAATLSLDGDWAFTWTPAGADMPTDAAFDITVPVPAPLDDHWDRMKETAWWPEAKFATSMGTVRYLSGVAWYRQNIDIPQDWADRPVVLTVGWAIGICDVYLNGEKLATYDYGVYTPFEVDLTEHLRFGQPNEITISVDNTRGFAGGWAFIGNAGKASGITRSVTLSVSDGPGRIADLYIRPGETLADVIWEAELSALGASPASTLTWTVTDLAGAELASGEVDVPSFQGTHKLTWSRRINAIKPWSPNHPNLYLTTLKWQASGDVDGLTQRFGMRRWSNDGRRLLLNGKPIYLRGEFGAYYYANNAITPTTKEYWVDFIRRAKRLGFNYINFAARVCPLELLEAADEEGMVMQCGDHVTVLEEYRDYAEEVWNPIVRWTRAYPSMSFYGFGGERNYYEGAIAQFQRQYDLIKSMNPECLVMPQQAIRGIDYAFDEKGKAELTPEPFPHHAERLAEYDKACDFYGHYSGGAFGYSYFGTPWQEMEKRFSIYDKPISIHELFMGMSYIDPDNAHRYTGRVEPYIYKKLRADLIKAGLLDRWRTYYANSGRLQARCQKYCVEKTRKCNEPSGFEYLGMYDNHYTPHYVSGMTDEFFNVKPGETEAGIRRYNGESVLLIDYPEISPGSINRSFTAGEVFEADLMISLFGESDISTGTLAWRLLDGERVVLSGTFTLRDIKTGGVHVLQRLSFTWPEVTDTTRLNLSLTLKAPAYDLANDWNFWVFPDRQAPVCNAQADEATYELLKTRYPGITLAPEPAGNGLRIVSAITAADTEYLVAGGSVLLLGSAPFFTHDGCTFWHSGLASRAHHNVGTVIRQHPVFRYLPHEGWGDWQFRPVIDGANQVLFEYMGATKFDPILEVISCGADVRKQAAMFEKRVGDGRLFVSTCVYNDENPSCTALMDGVLRYVMSDAFAPRDELPVEIIRSLAAGGPPAEPGNLIPAPGFEFGEKSESYWKNYGNDFVFDAEEVHSGARALRVEVTPEEFAATPGLYTGAMHEPFSVPRSVRRFRLSAWHKTENVTRDGIGNLLIFIYILHADGTRYTLRMPFEGGTHDWKYAEKIWETDKPVASATLYIGMAHGSGTAWFDDLYFGDAGEISTGPDAAQAFADVEWSCEPLTIKFGAAKWYRLGDGEWKQAESVRIATVGITTLSISDTQDGRDAKKRHVGIDAVPPTIKLNIQPEIDQEGGLYKATRATSFAVTAADELSGVKSLEISIDGADFTPYTKPFKLSVGTHEIRCRATDYAGNVGMTMNSDSFTHGGGTNALQLTIR